MKFALKQIASAAALVAVSSAAFAVTSNYPVSDYSTGTTDIYLAGSSAVDLALEKWIANNCSDNSLDSYRSDAAGKTYYLWTCKTDNASPHYILGSGNSKIAIHKNTNSSSDGVNGVVDSAAALAYLQVSDLSSLSGCTSATVASTATISAYNQFICGTTVGTAGLGTASVVANFGFADAEPAQFNAAKASQLTTAFPFSLIQGITVTTNLRNALQTQQGLTAGSETLANMPSISSATLNAIYTGRDTTLASLGLSSSLSDNKLYLLRRSNGSGTTRSFESRIVGNLCNSGLAAMTSATTLVTSTISTQCNLVGSGGTQKLQAGTSDDLVSCMNSLNTNGAYGVGYLTTDYTPVSGDGYRWLKIDGYTPSLKNVADGNYKIWSELSVNYNKATALTTDQTAFYNSIKNASASATQMSEVVLNLGQKTDGTNTTWTGGIIGAFINNKNASGWGLSITSTLAVANRTDAAMLLNPANPLSRATTTGYNLCANPYSAPNYVNE
jgi:hypothetical protein